MSYARKSAEKHFALLLKEVSLWVFPPKISIAPLISTAELGYLANALSFRIVLQNKIKKHITKDRDFPDFINKVLTVY